MVDTMVDMMIDTMVDNNRYNGWPKRATSIACIYPNVRSTRRLMIYTIPGRCCCRSPFSSLIPVYTWYARSTAADHIWVVGSVTHSSMRTTLPGGDLYDASSFRTTSHNGKYRMLYLHI